MTILIAVLATFVILSILHSMEQAVFGTEIVLGCIVVVGIFAFAYFALIIFAP